MITESIVKRKHARRELKSTRPVSRGINVALILLLAMLHAGIQASAQDSLATANAVRVGLTGGPQFNFYRGPFEIFEGSSLCGTFETGSGTAYLVAGLVEIPLSGRFFLRFSAGYSDFTGTFNAPVRLGTAILPSGELTDATADHTLDATLSYFAFHPAITYYPTSVLPLNIRIGPALDVISSKSFTQRERLTAPPAARFSDGTEDHLIGSGEIASSNSVRFGVVAGAGMDIQLSRNLIIAPEVHYDLPFTDVTSDTRWKASGLYTGIALKWAILPPLPKPPPPPPPPPVEPKKFSPPVIALQREGKTTDGLGSPVREIVLEEIRTTERRPLLPYIFFEQDDGRIPLRQNLLSREEARSFSTSAVTGSELEIYPHILNILGERLVRTPVATVTVTGTNNGFESERGNTALSRQRAQTIKDYLVDVWGIKPDRISTTARNLPQDATAPDVPEGQEENRRVEISSSNYEILNPLTREERRTTSTIASVDFIPTVTAEAGIERWDFTLKQGDRVLQQVSGASGDIPPRIRWEYGERPVLSGRGPVSADLMVEDKAGQRKALHDEIPVRTLTIEKKREERIGDMLVHKSGLIVFDFDKATLSDRNRRIIEEGKTAITPDSKVTIIGYTDALGDAEHNQRLSLQRAAAVRDALGSAVQDAMVIVKGQGGERILFPNDTPEGRFYCRMVQIIIETPVR